MDYYLPEVVEQLELACIPYEVMNTRRHPGIKIAERATFIENLHIVVELAIGWLKKPRAQNGSCIYYGHEDSLKFADRMRRKPDGVGALHGVFPMFRMSLAPRKIIPGF